MTKLTILTFVACYLPGHKFGGPVRSISNMVEHLGDEFDFRIVTRDRDALDTEPYPGVKVDDWNTVGKAQVFYASPQMLRPWSISQLLRETPHDVLYLNSFFSYEFTFLPLVARKLGIAPRRACVIAPRGEFSVGALALKAWKKGPYLSLTRALGLYEGLNWQASSKYEVEDIRHNMGKVARNMIVAPNLPSPASDFGQNVSVSVSSHSRPLRVIFLSLITAKKNLAFALRTLAKVQVPVMFSIYGPVLDKPYWRQCQDLIKILPKNIAAEYHGSIAPDAVHGVMAEHDLFFLPTLGENYGHVIPEALSAGTPVLITDTTPWRNLSKDGIGWDLPLKSGEDEFAVRIEEVAYMSPSERANWRRHVAFWASRKLSNPEALEANQRLFWAVTNTSS
ncbi:MAG: glycosyltransferase family 4 protein [Desulfobacteraceae bacterium]|nr:glycosyltransferase family 4 protein [Desulfobacteraceae bacterium]